MKNQTGGLKITTGPWRSGDERVRIGCAEFVTQTHRSHCISDSHTSVYLYQESHWLIRSVTDETVRYANSTVARQCLQAFCRLAIAAIGQGGLGRGQQRPIQLPIPLLQLVTAD